MINTIDLFSGCGGMSLGFSWAGFKSVIATDIDINCQETYKTNFPDTNFICKPISEIQFHEIEGYIIDNPIDVVIGGPPCQGFSLANKNRNKTKDPPRNKLFYEYLKFIEWINPKAFVMENVKGLLSMHKGEVIKLILDEFRKAGRGYSVDFKVLRASDYGVPQHRDRVIIIGIRNDLGKIPLFPEKTTKGPISVLQAVDDLPVINAGEGSEVMEYSSSPNNSYQEFIRNHSLFVHNHIAMKHTKRLIERFKAIKHGESLVDVWEEHGSVMRGNPEIKSSVKFGQNNQRLFGDRPAPTIAASFQSNFIHPILDRNFTAREGARLQSFPDSFIFKGKRTKMSWESGLSQYQQIGNAVPPLMAQAIAKKISECIYKRE